MVSSIPITTGAPDGTKALISRISSRPGRHRPGRPLRAVEDTVESAEAAIAIPSQDAQRRRDGAPAWRQDDAGEKQKKGGGYVILDRRGASPVARLSPI